MAKFKDSKGRYWEVDTSQVVQAFPAGGGFLLKLSLQDLLAMQVAQPEDYIPGRFVIADGDTIFEGYYRPDQRWNGWMMPLLTFESAMKLVESSREGTGWGDAHLDYDKGLDAFVYQPYAEDEAEEYPAETIAVDGKEIKLYGVGAGSWVWELYHPEPEEEADVSAT